MNFKASASQGPIVHMSKYTLEFIMQVPKKKGMFPNTSTSNSFRHHYINVV